MSKEAELIKALAESNERMLKGQERLLERLDNLEMEHEILKRRVNQFRLQDKTVQIRELEGMEGRLQEDSTLFKSKAVSEMSKN